MAKREVNVVVVWRYEYDEADTVRTLDGRIYEKDNIDPRSYLGESLPPYFEKYTEARRYMTANPGKVCQLEHGEARRVGVA